MYLQGTVWQFRQFTQKYRVVVGFYSLLLQFLCKDITGKASSINLLNTNRNPQNTPNRAKSHIALGYPVLHEAPIESIVWQARKTIKDLFVMNT